jgi:Peptidoglycan-binding protein, CsiV
MPKLTARKLIVPALLTLAGFSAQAQQNERWYQVELIIFSHETTSTIEQWEPIPQLNYPPSGRFLVYPGQVKARMQEHEGESSLDEFGRQLIVVPDDTEQAGQQTTDIPSPGSTAGVTSGNQPGTVAGGENNATSLYPTPFVTLPHSEREFHGKSAYMQRTGKYQTLFHETWAQPMRPAGTALPLIIDQSGDTTSWPRLQGSIKLHLSRYLHVETNLWLNTHGDYLPGEWRMPAPPLGPPSLVVEEPERLLETDSYFVSAADDPAEDQSPNTQTEPVEETGPVYPWRHAVLVQQKRRMRSNEVHYLDHPMLGAVIKFTPLDEDQLQTMAETQARSGNSFLN